VHSRIVVESIRLSMSRTKQGRHGIVQFSSANAPLALYLPKEPYSLRKSELNKEVFG
jgi:hypothetical protein